MCDTAEEEEAVPAAPVQGGLGWNDTGKLNVF